MIVYPPGKYRKPHAKAKAASTPAPVALTLVSATYETLTYVRLTFNQAIDISAIDAAAVIVSDGPGGWIMEGSPSAMLIDPNTVEIGFDVLGPITGDEVLMTVSNMINIVSAVDGSVWMGTGEVELPWP